MANHCIHTRRFLSHLLGLDLLYLPHLLPPSQCQSPPSPHLSNHRLLHSGWNTLPPRCRQRSYGGQIANCECPQSLLHLVFLTQILTHFRRRVVPSRLH
jgi:hypothetical protein